MLANYPPLLIQQGDQSFTYVEFEQPCLANIVRVDPGRPAIITTDKPHCLVEGDIILIRHYTQCCDDNKGCNTVTGVISPTEFTASDFKSTLTESSFGGYIAKPVDLTGYLLKGCVATKNPSAPTPPGLRATAVQGGSEIIVYGQSDISFGDLVSIPQAGISNAKVNSVFENCDDSNIQVITLADNVTASTTVEKVAITRIGQELIALEFDILDPKCGQVNIMIRGDQTSGLCLPSGPDNCGTYWKIGCYQLLLAQGYIPAPNILTDPCEFVSYQFTLMAGEAYLRPRICGF
jgi:hypothetical protein